MAMMALQAEIGNTIALISKGLRQKVFSRVRVSAETPLP